MNQFEDTRRSAPLDRATGPAPRAHGRGSHHLLMMLMCVPMLAVVVVVIASGGASGAALLVPIACMAMMAFMGPRDR